MRGEDRTLEEVRAEINALDDQLRSLLMRRMDLSAEVADIKERAGGRIVIYREDREQEILARHAEKIPPERRAVCLPVARKIMECSRMFQYGRIFDRHPELFETVKTETDGGGMPGRVRFRLTRSNKPNSMATILGMIGDYGFQTDAVEMLGETEQTVSFEIRVVGDLTDRNMKKLLCQLSMESAAFTLLD